MASIKSKIHSYGNEKESSWPPQFPENPKRVTGYIDPETGEFREGYPPNRNNQFGVAPMAIFDSMPPTYHEGACRMVESRGEWNRLDRETGCLTFGSVKEPRKHIEKGNNEQKKALRQDRRRASEEALKMVRANPKEINQKWEKHAEKQAKEAKESGLDTILREKNIL
jgi:hypothetical protein